MTKCKTRSMMRPEIEWSGANNSAGHLKPNDLRSRVFSVQAIASNLFLRETAQVAARCHCLIHPVVLVVIYDTLNIGKVVRHFPVVL